MSKTSTFQAMEPKPLRLGDSRYCQCYDIGRGGAPLGYARFGELETMFSFMMFCCCQFHSIPLFHRRHDEVNIFTLKIFDMSEQVFVFVLKAGDMIRLDMMFFFLQGL